MAPPLTLTLLPLLLPLLLLPHQAAAQTRCQWSTLRSGTDLVLETLTAGAGLTANSSSILSPSTSPDLSYTQNALPLSITSGESLPARPLEVLYRHSVVDQDACAGFVKLVVTTTTTPPVVGSEGEGGGDGAAQGGDANRRVVSQRHEGGEEQREVYVVGAQIHFNYTFNAGTTVRKVDLVFAGAGDWQMASGSAESEELGLDATALVGHLESEDWSALSGSRQGNRTVLEGVAGAYLDFLGGGGGGCGSEEGEGIWGRPCSRLDGGVYTAVGEAESCGLAREGAITERRFVVDPSVGAVSVLATDGSLGGAPSVFEFRVVDGKLMHVHQFAATEGVKTEG